MTRDQKKQIAEDLRNHKRTLRVSLADEFEMLSYSITAGECTDYNWARTESYLKAVHEIRQQESVVNEEIESLAKEILSWVALRKIQNNPVQVLKLVQGKEVTALVHIGPILLRAN